MTKLLMPILTLNLVLGLAFTVSAQAETVKSADAKVSIARVVKVVELVKKPGLQVSVAVHDLGGSTDVSPTQEAYLTVYSKGEMYDVEATFLITAALEVKSAKRVSGGIYEVVASVYEETIKDVTFVIDARKVVTDIQAVNCQGNFGCTASNNFKGNVEVSRK